MWDQSLEMGRILAILCWCNKRKMLTIYLIRKTELENDEWNQLSSEDTLVKIREKEITGEKLGSRYFLNVHEVAQ